MWAWSRGTTRVVIALHVHKTYAIDDVVKNPVEVIVANIITVRIAVMIVVDNFFVIDSRRWQTTGPTSGRKLGVKRIDIRDKMLISFLHGIPRSCVLEPPNF